MFNAPKLTNAGKALYYDNMAGTQIVFTTIQLGSGNISGPIAPMTALVTPVVTINAEAKSVSGQYAEISGHFSNAQLTDGFYFREIGVFAADPDYPNDRGKDILYCYQNAYDTADFIPVASVETVEKNITIPVIIGDAAAVSCTLSRSLILASMEDLDNHNKNRNAHDDIRTALEKKQEKITVNGLLKGDGKGGISAQQFDTKPSKDSGNLLTSGAVATAMDVAAALTSAAEYSAAATYAVGAYCTKGGKLYRCTVAIPQAEAWNAAHWTETTIGAELVAIYTTLANKAPAGYGLGSDSGHLITAADDLDTIIKNGTYQWGNYLPKNAPTKYCKMRVWCGAGWASQETMSAYAGEKDSIRRRVLNNGVWGPFEWVNPPMQLGVEYRTTERYLGKPVHIITFDFGALPASGYKILYAPAAANISDIVAYGGYTNGGTAFPCLTAEGCSNGVSPYDIRCAAVKNISGGIAVSVGVSKDRSAETATVWVKYTKNTE